jgi:drug/metabolite transporter (DMT)-like permease
VLAVVLALGTSVAYGTSNFLGPLLGRRHTLGAVLLTGQVAAVVVAGLIVLVADDPLPTTHGLLLGLLAGAGNVLGLAGFYQAATLSSVSVVSAIGGGIGTGLPVVFGLATGDALTPLQAVGIVVAILGGVLAAQSSEHAIVTRAGVGWSLVSAVGFGALLIALPEAAREDGTPWALLDARAAVVVLLVVGIAVLRAPVAAPARDLPLISVPGLLLLVGTIMYAEATQLGLLSVVAVLASLATVVTATLAFGVSGERLSRVQVVGILLATLGVILLAV